MVTTFWPVLKQEADTEFADRAVKTARKMENCVLKGVSGYYMMAILIKIEMTGIKLKRKELFRIRTGYTLKLMSMRYEQNPGKNLVWILGMIPYSSNQEPSDTQVPNYLLSA